ncbi:unnamed protein product (macronuclear) [Paramecium tetraurelia]|uniref:Uncharacterized protein n=1 Tax=Paramecium tetraurelia TaxID=5888 RepID=A0DTE9_PARTE|nr:uncharacterized protein GSPATT00019997001 [Paramecium tetraurelia]CAK86316.1 unnamed protein product [Paramecium tetraurelia]|eukprot:XP_001453713.1 hypothetical protein (macronuclear) [Paramecium tetraurelia strain d4-2]
MKINCQIILLIQLIKYTQTPNFYPRSQISRRRKNKEYSKAKKKSTLVRTRRTKKKKQKLTMRNGQIKGIAQGGKGRITKTQGDLDKKTLAKNNGEILQKFLTSSLKYSNYREQQHTMNLLKMAFYKVPTQKVKIIHATYELLTSQDNILRQKKDKLRSYLQFNLQSMELFQFLDRQQRNNEKILSLFIGHLDKQKIKITEVKEILILRALGMAFIKNSHFSCEVTGTFVRILIQLANNSEIIKFIYALCYCIKLVKQKYWKTQKVLKEDDNGLGMNSYNMKCDDPSCPNALNSQNFEEVKEMKNVFCPIIKTRLQKFAKIDNHCMKTTKK